MKTLRIDNIWIFPLSTSTLSQQKPYISKDSEPISKTLLRLEVVEGGHMGGKLQVHMYFTFAMARWKLCASKTFEITHFQHVHCPSKTPISPKEFNQISKTFLRLKDVEGGHLGGYSQVRWYFTFAMARWKLCASTTFEISHFQPVHCPSKNPISPKLINGFSKTLLQLEVVEGGHMGGKFQVRWYFTFAMTGEKFAHQQHLKYPTFNLYTVPTKILFLQRDSIEFRKLSLSSKTLKVGIWVEIFRCPGILPLRWQGENFAQRKHLKFPSFKLYTVPAKILYLQRY